jgi:three-Cys-motif partner protein
MIGKPAWKAGVVYVDLFAGPGVCTVKKTGQRVPGSTLIAAHAPKKFDSIIACELDPDCANACEARLSSSPAAGRAVVLRGDSNDLVDEVVSRLPKGALTLAFIDPEGLDARFETIRRLSSGRRVDLLILFADAYDILRNVDLLYMRDPNSKLDQTLGPNSNWRERWQQLGNRNGTNARALFAQIYQDQLRRELSYEHFRELPIRSDKGPLYKLIYASKSPRGLDFWDKAIGKDPGGQEHFDFG